MKRALIYVFGEIWEVGEKYVTLKEHLFMYLEKLHRTKLAAHISSTKGHIKTTIQKAVEN